MTMSLFQILPLLIIGLVVYAILTIGGVGVDGEIWHQVSIIALPLSSGDIWNIRGGDAFLVFNMGILFVELIRATKTDGNALTNHALSFVLFFANGLFFIFMPGFGTGVFFLYMAMTFLDPMAGMIVTTVTARRDFSVADGVAR